MIPGYVIPLLVFAIFIAIVVVNVKGDSDDDEDVRPADYDVEGDSQNEPDETSAANTAENLVHAAAATVEGGAMEALEKRLREVTESLHRKTEEYQEKMLALQKQISEETHANGDNAERLISLEKSLADERRRHDRLDADLRAEHGRLIAERTRLHEVETTLDGERRRNELLNGQLLTERERAAAATAAAAAAARPPVPAPRRDVPVAPEHADRRTPAPAATPYVAVRSPEVPQNIDRRTPAPAATPYVAVRSPEVPQNIDRRTPAPVTTPYVAVRSPEVPQNIDRRTPAPVVTQNTAVRSPDPLVSGSVRPEQLPPATSAVPAPNLQKVDGADRPLNAGNINTPRVVAVPKPGPVPVPVGTIKATVKDPAPQPPPDKPKEKEPVRKNDKGPSDGIPIEQRFVKYDEITHDEDTIDVSSLSIVMSREMTGAIEECVGSPDINDRYCIVKIPNSALTKGPSKERKIKKSLTVGENEKGKSKRYARMKVVKKIGSPTSMVFHDFTPVVKNNIHYDFVRNVVTDEQGCEWKDFPVQAVYLGTERLEKISFVNMLVKSPKKPTSQPKQKAGGKGGGKKSKK